MRTLSLDTRAGYEHLLRSFLFLHMANTKSALKYIRKTETRTQQNRQVKSRLKTLSKKVDAAVEAGDKEVLASSTKDISLLWTRPVRQLVHANKIARHKSRCAKLVSAQ